MPPTIAALSVLTERGLLLSIASFQGGWPWQVLLRWRELKPTNRTAFIDALLRKRDLATLQAAMTAVWYESGAICRFQVQDLRQAIASRDPVVLRWALACESASSISDTQCLDLWVLALRTFPDHFESLQLLHEKHPLPPHLNSSIQCEIPRLSLPSLKWLATNLGPDALPLHLLRGAALRGDLELAQWVIQFPGQRFDSTSYADIYDHYRRMLGEHQHEEGDRVRQVLEYLLHSHQAEHSSSFVHRVVVNGDVAMLRTIQTARGLQHLNSTLVTAAAAKGHIDTLRVLVDAKEGLITTDTLDKAASNGHLEVLDFLYSKGSARCSATGINGATGNGHLDIIQFLHDHATEAFSEVVIKTAAT